MDDNLTIEDLAKHTGLSLRTLRYYIQEGLLPGPDTQGKYARYSQQHLDQLELILRLKNLRLPLSEIRHLLQNMTPEEIKLLKGYQDGLKQVLMEHPKTSYHQPDKTDHPSSALEYIRSLEINQSRLRSITGSPSGYPNFPKNRIAPPSQSKINENAELHNAKPESWTRLKLLDGIELNIRKKEEVIRKKEIEKLIQYARELFKEK